MRRDANADESGAEQKQGRWFRHSGRRRGSQKRYVNHSIAGVNVTHQNIGSLWNQKASVEVGSTTPTATADGATTPTAAATIATATAPTTEAVVAAATLTVEIAAAPAAPAASETPAASAITTSGVIIVKKADNATACTPSNASWVIKAGDEASTTSAATYSHGNGSVAATTP